MKAFERLPGRQQQVPGSGSASTYAYINADGNKSSSTMAVLPKAGAVRPHSLVLNPLQKKVNQGRMALVAGSSPKRDQRPTGFDPSDLEGEDLLSQQQHLVAVRSPPKHPRERQQLYQQQQGLRSPSPTTLRLASGHNDGSLVVVNTTNMGDAGVTSGVSWEDLEDDFLPSVGDYCSGGIDPKVAVSELGQKFPRLLKKESTIRILPNQTTEVKVQIATPIDSQVTPGALSFEITAYDPHFFLQCPLISSEGFISIYPTRDLSPRHGTTIISYRVVDHSNFIDDSLSEFVSTQVETLAVEVVAPVQTTKKMKDWKSFQNKKNAQKGEAPAKNKVDPVVVQPITTNSSAICNNMSGGSGVQQQQQQQPEQAGGRRAGVDLPLPNLRIFRRTPPRVNSGLFASKFLRDEPLLLLRCCNVAAERRLLGSCDLPLTQLNPLLEQVKDLIKSNTRLSVLLPVLDSACRLHFRAGSTVHITTAQRMAKLRAQCVGKTLGIDTTNDDLLDMSVALRMASTKGGAVQQLIRVLVEGAHLFKNTGELQEALKFYKFAFNLASVVNDATRSASMIPFLVATGDVYLMRGELTQALDCYERARTFAEANGADTVVAECEDLVGLTYAVLGHHTDSQNALARSLKIREEADVDLALAESLLFHAYCSALRESYNQAELLVDRAVGLLEAEGPEMDSATKLLLVMAQCVAGWLHLGKSTRTSEVRYRLEQAVQLCKDATSEGSAEICIPLWLLQCYTDLGEPTAATYQEFSTVHCYASHHCSNACSFTSAIQMCGALTCPEKSEALMCIETGMAPILLNYDATYGLLLTYYEVQTVVLLRWRCYEGSQIQEAVDRLQWISLNGRRVDLLSTGISFRLTPIFAEAYTATRHQRAAAQRISGSGGSSRDDVDQEEEEEHQHNLDALMDTIALAHSKTLGEFSVKLVPLLLDVAELRYAHGKYQEALSILGRALKIADQHNIIYLLGQALFQPATLLTPQELAARDRLASERGAAGDQILELGTMLFQIAMTHEANDNTSQAISTYQKSLAIFEMSSRLSHPCAVATLTGLGRVQLKIGLLGDSLASLTRGEDIIQTYHYQFGQYKADYHTVELLGQHAAVFQAVKSAMWTSHYLLVEHTESRLDGAPIYY